MRQKVWIGGALCLLAGLGLFWLPTNRAVPLVREAPRASELQTAQRAVPAVQTPGQLALAAPAAAALRSVTVHPMATSFGSRLEAAAGEPSLLLDLFEVYRREFGSFPAGEDNPQMMHALMGANPDKLPIFPLKHPRLSPQGALLDAWGNPFHFHSISQDLLEIRSAGPDGQMFTSDDSATPQRPPESQKVLR